MMTWVEDGHDCFCRERECDSGERERNEWRGSLAVPVKLFLLDPSVFLDWDRIVSGLLHRHFVSAASPYTRMHTRQHDYIISTPPDIRKGSHWSRVWILRLTRKVEIKSGDTTTSIGRTRNKNARLGGLFKLGLWRGTILKIYGNRQIRVSTGLIQLNLRPFYDHFGWNLRWGKWGNI